MKQSNLQKRRIISWALVIVMMTVIFMFSAKTANDSEQMRMGVTRLVTKLMGITQAEAGTIGSSLYDMLSVIDHYVRKTAHFMEYALLAVLVFRALKIDVYQKIHLFFTAWVICIIYAATDELHQYFVPGRSCQIRDVMIDSAGALTGICICMLAGTVFRRIKKRNAACQ